MKTCSECDLEKDLVEFSKRTASKDGLQARCKSCDAIRKRAWQLANPDKCSDSGKRWRSRHPGREIARKATYYQANRRLIAERTARYREVRPDTIRQRNQLYRARKTANFVEHVDSETVYERDKWICQLCFNAVDPVLQGHDPMAKSLDHKIPLSLGGEHSYMNTQLAHFGCNASKGNRIQPAYAVRQTTK